MTRKVVTPARTSVRTVVPCSRRWKNRSSPLSPPAALRIVATASPSRLVRRCGIRPEGYDWRRRRACPPRTDHSERDSAVAGAIRPGGERGFDLVEMGRPMQRTVDQGGAPAVERDGDRLRRQGVDGGVDLRGRGEGEPGGDIRR